jgi:hypothetical protein
VVDEIDRRRFLRLSFLAFLAGCAPKPYTADDRESQFAKLEEARRSDRLRASSYTTTPFRLPERKIGDSVWRPEIRPHYEWTSSKPISSRLNSMGSVFRMTVHHEGNENPNYDVDVASVKRDLEIIRKVHLDRMRAGDIGYHYIIDRAGRIWEGRYLMYQGAHVGGSNNVGNIGVMLLGNFDIQQPSEEQKDTLKKFLVYLKDTHNIKHSQIYTHQELKVSRCPGTHLQAYMNELRRTTV